MRVFVVYIYVDMSRVESLEASPVDLEYKLLDGVNGGIRPNGGFLFASD